MRLKKTEAKTILPCCVAQFCELGEKKKEVNMTRLAVLSRVPPSKLKAELSELNAYRVQEATMGTLMAMSVKSRNLCQCKNLKAQRA